MARRASDLISSLQWLHEFYGANSAEGRACTVLLTSLQAAGCDIPERVARGVERDNIRRRPLRRGRNRDVLLDADELGFTESGTAHISELLEVDEDA